jgi:hypothetical protein
MTQCNEFRVDRKDFRKTQKVSFEMDTLADGAVRVAIDMFGLTANNVSYALTGDMIGYWGYFPAEDDWGKVPVWGCANVEESNCADVPVGDRLWGFFPMASHVDLVPGRIRVDQFTDIAEHRQALPDLYNNYRRTAAEPSFLTDMEIERCLYFPLFTTSFVLYDYLIDNNFFGAQQVIIGSVSSKTGFGLAKLLHDDAAISQKVIGLTSPANVALVESLACCDEVLLYGDESKIDAAVPAAYVDMSGDAKLTTALHQHLQSNMVESCMVGATHWDQGGTQGDLPGAKPQFFFAPAQIGKRNEDWGPGVVMEKAGVANARLSTEIADKVSVEWTRNIEGLQALWLDTLDNKISAKRGQMVSLARP